jgi:DNA helicase-2/ATP-dependent DNA helicase PcrA
MTDPASKATDPAADKELRTIVAEEEKLLKRCVENLAAVPEVYQTNYDREMVELRDLIGDARNEDLPALMAEMERLRGVATRRAEIPVGKVDQNNPYFGHMRLVEGGRSRDVLIGNSTYVDTERGVRIVDWRDAPVSRIYYRYQEGDEYEEEFGGKTLEGTVTVRRAVVIRGGALKRVVAPQGVFYQNKEGWQRATVHAAKLQGGQLSAVRPPTEDERREAAKSKGRLGVGVEGREDKHLPEIPSLIDPRQFELITRPSSGLAVIQGGAGSGKTTIGLHRMAYLSFNNPKRFAPENMMVVVFNRALARYIVRVLPGLGVEGVHVTTYLEWVHKQRRKHLSRVPAETRDDTPAVVSRVKKHPMMLKLIDERIADEEQKAKVALLETAKRNSVEERVAKAWKALDGNALSRRLTALGQWARGERDLGGSSGADLGVRLQMDLQKAMDPWMRRARDVVWDWAELITDYKALRGAADRWAPGVFTDGDLSTAVRWSTERCTRWVVADTVSEDDEERERGAERGDRRSKRKGAKDRAERTAPSERVVANERARFGDEETEPEDLGWEAAGDQTREESTARASRREDDDDDHRGGGGDVGMDRGADGVREDQTDDAIDAEDEALLLRLYQVKRGPLRGPSKQPLKFEHLFVDEAQDLSPMELSVLLGVASHDCSVTLAGDTAQRLMMDNGFSDWSGVLRDLGLSGVEVEPLRIGYRSTLEVLAFARDILGHLAEPEPPLATRHGAPVEFHGFNEVGAAVAFLSEALRELSMHEPRANVAVIARDPERADVYYDGLFKAEVPRLARVADQDFSFRPGVEVTDIRQVKGLEFDYVILVDVTLSQYPADDESRHLLHIGATRAAHQLWVVSTGIPSPILPRYMIED